MGIFYLLSKRVLRSIPYGEKPRNRLDMYIPRNHWKNPDVCIPVVIYVTGSTIIIMSNILFASVTEIASPASAEPLCRVLPMTLQA